eukprot:CAMPEP_0202889846 /NCGR_PEP_ID=MMETSP1392-20130828/403_1 /ASSEMBLY_ACC=CAM_ASM_000868 /TAXON_ID=225041 /ORGANISM="Chlamydomonas chlamydogama, Strain SAG 11-48b" /LENGTH=479 /DNA_ID=CAMNT_0049573275 /DNA_START=37 /DNA_END=1476 /DNA_ORIENTATION=+
MIRSVMWPLLVAVLFTLEPCCWVRMASADYTTTFKGRTYKWNDRFLSSSVQFAGGSLGSQAPTNCINLDAISKGQFVNRIETYTKPRSGTGTVMSAVKVYWGYPGQAPVSSCTCGTIDGAAQQAYILKPGVGIKSVFFRGGEVIDQLGFTFNDGTGLTAGGSGGTRVDVTNLGGRMFAGFMCAGGKLLDQFAWVFLNDVIDYTVIDVKYPTLGGIPPVRIPTIVQTFPLDNRNGSQPASFSRTVTSQKGTNYRLEKTVSDSQELSWSVTASAGFKVPLLQEASVSVTVGGVWTTTTSQTTAYSQDLITSESVTQSLTCPAATACRYTFSQFTSQISDVPFTATSRITLVNGVTILQTMSGRTAALSFTETKLLVQESTTTVPTVRKLLAPAENGAANATVCATFKYAFKRGDRLDKMAHWLITSPNVLKSANPELKWLQKAAINETLPWKKHNAKTCKVVYCNTDKWWNWGVWDGSKDV